MRLPKYPQWVDAFFFFFLLFLAFFFFFLLFLAFGQMLEWHEPMAQKWRDGYLLMIIAVVGFGGKAFR